MKNERTKIEQALEDRKRKREGLIEVREFLQGIVDRKNPKAFIDRNVVDILHVVKESLK